MTRHGGGRQGRRRGQRLGAAFAWPCCVGLAVVLSGHLFGDAADAQPGATAAGEELYRQHCVQCHGVAGQGTYRGPTLAGTGAAGADFYLRTGRMPIADPDEEVEGGDPHFEEEQIRHLVDYVAGLVEGPAIPRIAVDGADRARGGELYRLHCAACHNWDGKGGALVGGQNAPRIHTLPPTLVAEAVRVGPGSMPTFSPDVLSDEDLEAVVAYVLYLRDPRDAGGHGLAHWGPATEALAAFVALAGLLLVTGWLGSRRT